MEFRTPTYLADGRIDCEVNHPVFGWAPFTASATDPDPAGAALFADIVAAGNIAPYVPPAPPTPDWSALINAERDRRILANFSFGGVPYNFDEVSKGRISGASVMALAAMGQGAQPGDTYWHGGVTPFVWVAADNSLNVMDAQTCFAFGLAAASHDRAHIYAGHALKAMDPVPADFADDTYWPAAA
jgi:hypothetical protein